MGHGETAKVLDKNKDKGKIRHKNLIVIFFKFWEIYFSDIP